MQIRLMYLFAQGAGPADLGTVLLNLWLGSHLQEATARDDFLMELWHSQQNRCLHAERSGDKWCGEVEHGHLQLERDAISYHSRNYSNGEILGHSVEVYYCSTASNRISTSTAPRRSMTRFACLRRTRLWDFAVCRLISVESFKLESESGQHAITFR